MEREGRRSRLRHPPSGLSFLSIPALCTISLERLTHRWQVFRERRTPASSCHCSWGWTSKAINGISSILFHCIAPVNFQSIFFNPKNMILLLSFLTQNGFPHIRLKHSISCREVANDDADNYSCSQNSAGVPFLSSYGQVFLLGLFFLQSCADFNVLNRRLLENKFRFPEDCLSLSKCDPTLMATDGKMLALMLQASRPVGFILDFKPLGN